MSKLRQISDILNLPPPLAYSTMQLIRFGSVSTSFSQVPSRSVDFIKTSTLPTWLQNRICKHVSGTCAQLGQSGQRERSQGLFPLTGAMSMICLQAHIWNILGTLLRVIWIISQSTLSNWSAKRTLASWNQDRASCLCTQNCNLSPLSEVSLLLPRNTQMGSRGNRLM
jgi:hypothetical protein